MGDHGDDVKGSDQGGSDEPIGPVHERAAFTRRTFLAGAGAVAAATAARPAMAFAAGGVPIYRIHPAIGVARMGNAPSSEYFVGPEIPGYGPLNEVGSAVPNYKNAAGEIKPQAARFRLYEYAVDASGKFGPVREVNLSTPGVTSIQWRVHLANRKAAFHRIEGGQGDATRTPVVPGAPLRNPTVTDRASLEIDPGSKSVGGRSAGPVACKLAPGAPGPRKPDGTFVIDELGELRTDNEGRLLVIGGKGKAGFNTATQPEMPHWANNDNWFDDASDGPVTATVTIDDNGTPRTIDVDVDGGGAWVMCGPPDFAPGIPGSVTGYDLLFDLAVGSGIALPPDHAAFEPGGPLADVKRLKPTFPTIPSDFVRFEDHIEPQLIAAYNLWYIEGLVNAKHNSLLDEALANPGASAKAKRERVFQYMRPPGGAPSSTGSRSMPKLLGDDPYSGQFPDHVRNLAVTRTQYELLRTWAAGQFTVPSNLPPVDASYWGDANALWAAYGLDRAALENCVGGAFFPGIEFGWLLRNPSLYFEPFRLQLDAPRAFVLPDGTVEPGTIGAGYFSRQMAVPWQADFNDCRNEGNYGWWPTQRPTHAITSPSDTKRIEWARPSGSRFAGGNRESTHEDMLNNWSKFGFVLATTTPSGTYYLERERASSGIV